ncbi:MAG: mucoidy inhibitor MuiA family protein [Hyphomicrobiaceae bacterium]
MADAEAADIKSQSRIVDVTVFPSGAEVQRTAKVKVPAGDHTLLFLDLPAQTIASSVRVEGRASGGLEIGSVDTRRIRVPHADPAAQESERRRLEEEIEKLNDEKALLDAATMAAAKQLALVEKLTELPVNPTPAGPQGGAGQPDWNSIFTLIGQRAQDAQKAQIDAQLKTRAIDRKITDLKKKLASLAPAPVERTEVKVNVQARGDSEADLVIRYQVSSASWVPYYDARLATGSKTDAPALVLVRRASIQQRTGEDWVDVGVKLSTTRPGSGSAAPELHPMIVDFQPDMPPPRPVAMPAPAMAPAAENARSLRAKRSMRGAVADKMAELVVEQRAQVDAAAFQAVFTPPGKLTVMATGEQKRVQLDEVSLAPTLVVRTVPRLNPKAYLYAKASVPKETPYLPGRISLFRDGTFVGTGRLPQLAPGEEHELGFGEDDAVRVKHALVEEKRGESGLITSVKTDQRSFKISVKNQHQRAIQLTILDQIPASNNQDIKVELLTRTPPSRQNVEDRRGVLAWDQKLEAGEERVLEFGYKVQWPAAKKVQYN